jgi:hypothetical protein
VQDAAELSRTGLGGPHVARFVTSGRVGDAAEEGPARNRPAAVRLAWRMDDVIVEVHPRGDDDRALLAAMTARLGYGAVEYRCAHCGGSDHGQPRVPGGFVSLARAGDLVAFAATVTGPVGIDIETVDRVAASGFDDVAFTETERRRIARADQPDLLRATLWTAKEALLKASGTGLRTAPREVEVAEASARIETTQPRPGYVLTVAVLSA